LKVELHYIQSAGYLQLIRAVIFKYDIYFLVPEYDLQSHALCIRLFTICFAITDSLSSFQLFFAMTNLSSASTYVYLTSAYFSVSVPRKYDLIFLYHIPHVLLLVKSTFLIHIDVFLPTKECLLLFHVKRIL
jgi:hypothetical protein